MADERWLNVVDVNLNGLFWRRRAFGRPMLKAKRGSVVDIGSMSGFIVNQPQPQAQHNASKAGVRQLTKSLAVEWAPRGVRVNAVAPTYIDTPLNAYVKRDKAMFEPGSAERRWRGWAKSQGSACGAGPGRLRAWGAIGVARRFDRGFAFSAFSTPKAGDALIFVRDNSTKVHFAAGEFAAPLCG